MNNKKGKLYLIPSYIGNQNNNENFPEINLQIANKIQFWVVENVREFRRFLKKLGVPSPYDHLEIVENNKRSKPEDIEPMIKQLLSGQDVGLVSDAGCPGVADPGSYMVQRAHEHSLDIVPLIGPSSILLALMASGFNGQKFSFHGYLPVKENEFAKALKALEQKSKNENSTEIFIETPYRNKAIFEKIIKELQPKTRLCVAYSILSSKQSIKTMNIQNWRKIGFEFEKEPCIFLIMY